MTESRESVVRLIWRATMPEGLVFVAPFLALLLVQVWLYLSEPLSTTRFADLFRFPMFSLGSMLLTTAFLADASGLTWGDRLRRLCRMTRRQARSSDRRSPGTGRLADGPGATAVAQPIVVALGSACLGAALGLHLIVVTAGDRPFEQPRSLSIAMAVAVVLILLLGAFRVTVTTRRLYLWSQEATVAAVTAEADAARAKIAALQSQLNPCFLFNALDTVERHLGEGSDRARRTLRNLSGMLSHTLERSANPLTTVEDEMRFVRDYLDIEHERFGSRLQVTCDIDPDTTSELIPAMSVQPLVENAVKHAVASRLDGGHVRVVVAMRPDRSGIRIAVEDDGPGFAPGDADGTGLRNLRSRLQALYGPDAGLRVRNLSSGANVTFTVPRHARADR
jgi:signal transduction histidine kinase